MWNDITWFIRVVILLGGLVVWFFADVFGVMEFLGNLILGPWKHPNSNQNMGTLLNWLVFLIYSHVLVIGFRHGDTK